jgi:hypothetical protein
VLLRGVFGAGGVLRTDGPAWTFMAVAISVLLTGGLGFILAEFGWFDVWLIAAIEVLGSLVALWLAAGERRAMAATARGWLSEMGARLAGSLGAASWRSAWGDRATRVARIENVVLVALLLLGAALFARPAEMIRGALDSGTYVNAGVALGRTGALVLTDPLMRQLRDDDPVTFQPVAEARQFLQPLNLERYTLNRLRMPGFYMLEKKSGMVLPQFYSLYPVWIAIGYQLFGLGGALLITPLLALLACAAVFFFARRMFSTRIALVGLAFLITCPLQIWFARYPVSEIPTEMLAFIFFYAFLRFSEASGRLRALRAVAESEDRPTGNAEDEWAAASLNARFFGVMAGAALSEIALTRVDFIFYLAPLPLYLLWWRLSRTWRREHTWFAVTVGIGLLNWFLYYLFFAFAYTMDEYHNVILDQRRRWDILLPLLYGGVIALILIDRMQPRLRPLLSTLGTGLARRRRWLLGAACVLAGAYLFYRYLWEPRILFGADALAALRQGHIPFAWQSYIGAPLEAVEQTGKSNQTGLINYNSYILVRVGWYLSPLGIALGAIGLLRALWKRLNGGTAYFFGVLLILGGLFTTETFTNPVYPYSLRHFLPVVIPGLLVLGAYALGWAAEKWRPHRLIRPAAWATAAALIVFFFATGWVIINHVEDEGAIAEVSTLAARFPDPQHTILLFSNERDEPYVVATPLQYIYGFNCFSLNLPYGSLDSTAVDGAITRWQKQGYNVYMILGANGGKVLLPNFDLVPYTTGGDAQWVYNVPELEQLKSQKPKNIAPSTLPWGLYALEPRASAVAPGLPFALDIGGLDYKYLVGGFTVQEKTKAADSDYWRWTGNDALLRLPWPDTARAGMTLTLRLSAGPAQRAVLAPKNATPAQLATARPGPNGTTVLPAPAQVTILAGKQQLGQATLPLPPTADPIFQDVTVSIPATAPRDPADAHYVLIHITSTTWSPAEAGVSGDERALGVMVDSVSLSAAPTASGEAHGR